MKIPSKGFASRIRWDVEFVSDLCWDMLNSLDSLNCRSLYPLIVKWSHFSWVLVKLPLPDQMHMTVQQLGFSRAVLSERGPSAECVLSSPLCAFVKSFWIFAFCWKKAASLHWRQLECLWNVGFGLWNIMLALSLFARMWQWSKKCRRCNGLHFVCWLVVESHCDIIVLD